MPHKNNNCRFNINYFFSLYVYFNAAIECDDGTYGYACVNNCSGHCINSSLCNKETGYCHNGCNAGYTNKDCSRGMIFHFSLWTLLLTYGSFDEFYLHHLFVHVDFKTTVLWLNILSNVLMNLTYFKALVIFGYFRMCQSLWRELSVSM